MNIKQKLNALKEIREELSESRDWPRWTMINDVIKIYEDLAKKQAEEQEIQQRSVQDESGMAGEPI